MSPFCIDRAIIVWNGNPFYNSYWNFISKIWKNNFGITPTLIYVGEPSKEVCDYHLCEQYGEIHFLPEVKEVVVNPSRDWAVTWALFYGATLFPDDVCMTHGVDQVPLSDKFLRDMDAYDFEKGDYVIGLVDAHYNEDWHVSSNHVAKGSTYKTALSIEDDWSDEVKKVFEFRNDYGDMYGGGDYWGLEEIHSSVLLKKYDRELLKEHMGYEDFDSRMLNLNANAPDLERLRKGGYSEMLAPRPFWVDPKILSDIIDHTPKYC